MCRSARVRAIPDTCWTRPGVTHNPKVAGSNPAPATKKSAGQGRCRGAGPLRDGAILYRMFYRTPEHRARSGVNRWPT